MSVDNAVQSEGEQKLVVGDPVRPLTRQELHVLDLLGQGCTNEEIAGELNITASTVSSHVQHILKKLQVRNRVEAVLYIRHSLGQLEGFRLFQPVAPNQEQIKAPETRPISLYLRDPLLFLSQINHINWCIAIHGPIHIDYFGIAGDVTVAYYDPCARQLRIRLALYSTRPGEINIEVDEYLWKYLLELVEVASNALFSPYSPAQSGTSTESAKPKLEVPE